MTPLVALVAIAVFWWDSVDLSFFTTTVSLAASSSSRRCFLSPDVKECWRKELEEIKKGITDISCVKNHVQVTCVRPRLMLTMEMDGGGEIERN
jgi:hypothetical protein